MHVLPRGIRYYGGGGFSGYDQAAVANVRALVNAGIAVQWIPLEWAPERMQVSQWVLPDGRRQRLLEQCGSHGHLADAAALVAHTAGPVAHDVVVAHAPPEFWPFGFEAGKRNIGVTVWETDRAPAHWLPLMRQADRVIVPCEFNRAAFVRSGLRVPIAVVPHIRRHLWCEFSPSAVAAARAQLGIPPDDRVLYTINSWGPRKNLPAMIHAYARAFSADDPVTLMIKTDAHGHAGGPFYPSVPTRELASQAMADAAAATGRPVPRIVLHDAPLDGDSVDMIHAIGDIYVSLSHGEGWGLGAFETAMLGKPVVMTGWGGQCEFLGTDWPGAVPYRLESVPLWPPHLPSYFPSQRWAVPDVNVAATLLRTIVADPQPALVAAWTIRERIVRDFAEPVVIGALLEALA